LLDLKPHRLDDIQVGGQARPGRPHQLL